MSQELYKRFKIGAPRRYETPLALYRACCSYFKSVDDNPWFKKEAIKSGPNSGDIIDIPTTTPYTLKELQLHMGVGRSFFSKMAADKTLSDDFKRVIEWAQDMCDVQKFKGASIGVFNARIISADLGLADKHEMRSVIEIVDPNETEDPDAN